jgi:glycosyltransferase involved in cell wall biosynthesis
MDTTLERLKPDISLIVPVFNVEKFLIRCLDSIFNQKFSGTFEVIAVDDGSTDNSLQILKKYQSTGGRLKIIEHGFNKKLSVTRATGMNAAAGNYIMHVDSDDWILPDALENLYVKCIETGADIVVFNHMSENPKGKRTVINCIKKELVTTDKIEVQQHFFGAPWNKIVKRDLTKNLISGEIGVNNTEDLIYATEIFLKAEKICLIPEIYYVYSENNESLSRLVKPEQYIKYQAVILSQLQKIVFKYEADSKTTSNIMDYFEKWIYLELAKVNFWYNESFGESNILFGKFSQFPIMSQTRINKLELSMNNKLTNLLEVIKRFGFKTSLGIIIRSFKDRI